jgi:hypothetical protein
LAFGPFFVIFNYNKIIKVMKKGMKPDEVFFIVAATIGISTICVFALSAILNLIIHLIK